MEGQPRKLEGRGRGLDSRIGRIASRQHGAVARRQLLAAGVSAARIQRRIESGALIPIHRGVYLVGHSGGSSLAALAAAILACGPSALLCGGTAARLWGIADPPARGIEVVAVGRRQRSHDRVRIRFITALGPTEARRIERLPVTSPSLTLLDLAGRVHRDGLSQALNEARVKRLVDDGALAATLALHSRRRGARALRRLLRMEEGPRITRSEAERRALRLMRAHGLEPDESDARVGPWRVDFLFRAERVAVEVDGFAFHSTPRRFAEDRRRQADLAARGVLVFPLGWRDLAGRAGDDAMRRLTATLGRR